MCILELASYNQLKSIHSQTWSWKNKGKYGTTTSESKNQ